MSVKAVPLFDDPNCVMVSDELMVSLYVDRIPFALGQQSNW